MVSRKKIIRQVLDDHGGNGYNGLRFDVSCKTIDADGPEYGFWSWRVRAFLYGADAEGNYLKDADKRGLVEVGSATALIIPGSFSDNGRRVWEALDDHSQGYADIGAHFISKDHPSLTDFWEQYSDYTLPELMIIPWVTVKKEFRGHQLSLEILKFTATQLGRTASFVFADATTYDEEAEDVSISGTRRMEELLTGDGWTRFYNTNLFVLSNEGYDLTEIAGSAPEQSWRFSTSYGPILIAPRFGLTDEPTSKQLPVSAPETGRSWPFAHTAAGVEVVIEAMPDPDAMLTFNFISTDETVGARTENGQVILTGQTEPELMRWATAFADDWFEWVGQAAETVQSAVDLWAEGKRPGAPDPGTLTAQVVWLPAFTGSAHLPDGGELIATDRSPRSFHADISVIRDGQSSPYGNVSWEGAEVLTEIRMDAAASHEEAKAAADWVGWYGAKKLFTHLVGQSVTNTLISRLAGPEFNE